MDRVKVAPSLMCADFLHLQEQLDVMQEMGADYLHVDIMDGHYVPNFTLGPDFCRRVAGHCSIPLDIHLMIEPVDAFIPVFASIGRPNLYIHPEVTYHPVRSLQLMASCGAQAGIALDPALPVEAVRSLLPHVQRVCVMTVNPGYAGQKLVPGTLEKVRELADLIESRGYPIEIEVDGNVSWENVPRMVEAGAGILVAGTSSVFEQGVALRAGLQRLYRLIGRS